MHKHVTAALLVIGALITGIAAAQTPPPNPTQRLISAPQDGLPVFRMTVVGRTIPAINYRPRRGETKIDFVGSSLMPQARGEATVKGEKGYIEIDAKFKKLQAPQRFGPEYLTYVVWAITPEGRASNLGELQVREDDGDLRVTTELQAFGLVVTAEPYFAVSQPSDVVVIENIVRKEGIIRDATIGDVEVIQAKYELLKRGSYLMNQDAARLKVKPLQPGAPLDLAEARNAVELARLASADRYAPDTFGKASRLLSEAELARERKQRGNAVMMPARQAAQTAEDSRLIAIQKQEEAYLAEQKELARQREAAALERARAEETARLRAEIEKQSADARRQQAEVERLNADAARIAAEREKAAAESERLAAERQKADAERQRADAEAARAAAESARLAAETQAQQAQALAAQSDREKAELRDKLREQLNIILETRETARGLIVNLSDVLFDTDRASLRPGAREKLSRVAGILLSHPGLKIEVEGHADSTGPTGYNQRLSEHRADSVRDYLVGQGIAPGTVATSGFGETQPVATNATAAGRQQNRRVELVVSGEPIGRLSRDSTGR
jgi:outer membrane protein OmpA-like peptidoglycan-associated protein